MTLRFLVLCVTSLLLPACATEVLGTPDESVDEPVAASSEELASSSSVRPFQSFYLPASREVLCVFSDARTYRGAASSSDAAYQVCNARASAPSAGSFRVGIKQTRAANGVCTTAVYVDNVAYNQRTSACNANVIARSNGGTAQTLPFGGGGGPQSWWFSCGLALLDSIHTAMCAADVLLEWY